MAQYIDKSALVATIKKLKMDIGNIFNEYDEGLWEGRTTAFDDVICTLDTLEVKDAVDAEILEVEDNSNSMYAYTHLEICTDEDLSKICKAGDKAKVIIIKQNGYESDAM